MSIALVKKIMKGTGGVGHMATVEGKTPRVRPMTFHLQGKVFVTSTFAKSPKVTQVKANALTEVSWWDPKVGMMRVTGKVAVVTDAREKAEFYRKTPMLKDFFKTATDPNFTMLELRPTAIRVMPADSMEYVKVKL